MSDTRDPVIVRGYGCVFGESIEIDGLIETVAPGAFDLRACWDCRMIFGEHSQRSAFARTSDQSLFLFQDDCGLGFEARIDASVPHAHSIVRAIAAGDTARASVNIVTMDASYHVQDAQRHRTINRARIDHIAIVAVAAYGGTGVWLADAESEGLHPRLAALRDRWHRGLNARHVGQVRAVA